MKKNTNISLQILLLNDLLRNNTIDQEIYDRVAKKITTYTSESRTAH